MAWLLPGAFTHTDGDGEPDEQDTIWFKQAKYDAAKKALAEDYGRIDSLAGAYRRGGFRGVLLWAALQLAFHEYAHNMVPRHETPEQSKAWLEEHCSHPRKAAPALRHAKRTGFKTNAFSGVFRWRVSEYRRDDFLEWFQRA